MKKTVELISAFLVGSFITIVVLTSKPCIKMESDFKVNPDYRLEVNGKVVDTIWIYNAKNK
jgi:hypothetical protein